MPGRLIGVSRDSEGNPALRMAIQTREQHIRRDKATSNICTAQVLLAIGASMYGVYHGPEGLRAIASRINRMTAALAAGLRELGHKIGDAPFFDTLKIEAAAGCDTDAIVHAAAERRINLRRYEDGTVGITFDETTMDSDIRDLLEVFAVGTDRKPPEARGTSQRAGGLRRARKIQRLHDPPVFNSHRSETELLRYVTMLQSRDLSLAHSMIPLGSCTMKLNAASEMLPITWPQFSNIHPFAPTDQAEGYFELFRQLESWLGEITGFDAISLQPNAGSQGEYAGLMVIAAYHAARGERSRTKCIIPLSAHGTNPASAVVAGMEVVPVKCTIRATSTSMISVPRSRSAAIPLPRS